MVTFRDLVSAFRDLDIGNHPVIVHASTSAYDEVRGGVDSLLGALLSAFPAVMMPSFTAQTLIVPETGPEANALQYGTGQDQNVAAEFFRKRLPADPEMGALAEALRNAISRGELAAGERLPSTRALAESLGVSRGTVTEAYEQLMDIKMLSF